MGNVIAFDFQDAKLERRLASLDDTTLLFVFLGLLAMWRDGEQREAPTYARSAFIEIVRRWIPMDVFVDAFNMLEPDEDD